MSELSTEERARLWRLATSNRRTLLPQYVERILAGRLADANTRLAAVEAVIARWDCMCSRSAERVQDYVCPKHRLRAALRSDPSEGA